MHGKKILKILQKIFSWLPLATVIDHKVLIVHGGISDTTDLDTIARVDRYKVRDLQHSGINLAVLSGNIQNAYMCVFNLCFWLYLQYVSALRPPKLMINRNGSDRSVDSRRRVCSLTHYGSALAHKRDLPRRSLHSLPVSSQLNWSVEEELKRRRRLAGFDQCYGEVNKYDSDSDPDSGETMETDEHEWKQVSDRKDVGSQWQQSSCFNTTSWS